MKKILLLSVWLCSALFALASEGLEQKIVGIWEYKRGNESRQLTGYTILEKDGTGYSVGSMTQEGRTMWVIASITWKIENSKLVQTIVRANFPNMPPGKQSSDTIISVDEKTYVHKGGKKEVKELRVTKLPEEFAAQLAKFKAAK